MSQPETPGREPPNPERKSDSALLCFGIGVGLMFLAWLMGFGGVLAAALSGGNPAAVAGGVAMLILLPLTAVSGFVLALIGGIWMLLRVIADQRASDGRDYGRDVER